MLTSLALTRFIAVFVLSFAYGLNRQKSHKPVGFGTFILIAVGACALAIFAVDMDIQESVIGAIVTGIGFLGAGALIRNSDKVFGFTTAASIWFFAIFGLLVGSGEYVSGGIIYIMVWVVALFDKDLERNAIGSYRRRVVLECKGLVEKTKVTKILAANTTEFYLYSTFMNKKEGVTTFTYVIEGPKEKIEPMLKSFYKQSWCRAVKFE